MRELHIEFEPVIRKCLEKLQQSFTKEESVNILISIVTFRWKKELVTDFFMTVNENIYDKLNNLDNAEEIIKYNYGLKELRGLMNGLVDRVDIDKDKTVEEALKEVINMVNSIQLYSIGEVRKFINNSVFIGMLECGAVQTPKIITKLILNLIDINSINTFADFCCGASTFAAEYFRRVREEKLKTDVFYYGQEINTTFYLISLIVMKINGINNYEIDNSNVLVEYRDKDKKERKFDFIFSDIPQALSWSVDNARCDERFRYGIPPKNNADWAFIQNIIYSLNDRGIGIVLAPKGALVRGSEINIRKGIIEGDLVECVISLPLNLYENNTLGIELIILNKSKDYRRKNNIIFINASKYGVRVNRNQHEITQEGFNKILDCYYNMHEELGFSRVVGIEKIMEYNYTLNPIEYLEFDMLKNSFKESIKLSEVAKILRGVQISKEDMFELKSNATHYYLNVKDIEDGRIVYDETTMIKGKKDDWSKKYEIRANDIIITSKGWNVKFAIVEEDYKEAYISGNLSIIRVNRKKYNPYVLLEFLQSNVGSRMIEGIQTGTTVKVINTSKLEKLEVPYFNIELMNELGNEMKENKNIYEEKIKQANLEFYEKKEVLNQRLEELTKGIY